MASVNLKNVRFFWWESAKRKMDRWQLRIDNYWKFRFHEKIKKKRKKRERIKKIIIDYQKNKKRNYRFGDTLSIVK